MGDAAVKRKCVVLLSGGLDSTMAMHWAMNNHEVLAAVTVNYQQRHWVETAQAVKIAKAAKVRHELEHMGMRGVGLRAALTTDSAGIVTAADAVVPCRNLALLTVAAAWLERLGGDALVVGFSLEDAADFPDCRPSFVRAASSAISQSLGRKVLVMAPFVNMTKAKALVSMLGCDGLRAALGKTWTCYTPVSAGMNKGHVRPCGTCPACVRRAQAFEALGIADPAAGKEVRA